VPSYSRDIAQANAQAIPSRTGIALVIGQLGLGGAEKQLSLLAAELPRWGYEPVVITLSEGGEWQKFLRARGIAVHEVPRRGHFDFGRLLKTARILRRYRPAIVHGFDGVGSVYGKLAGVLVGVPILVGGVRCEAQTYPRVILVERLLRGRTAATISNSLAGKRDWLGASHYPADSVRIVANGFDFDAMREPPAGFRRLRELLTVPADAPIVGTIGTLWERKNPSMFLDVAAGVRRAGRRAHFVWIGDGSARADVERARRAQGLEDVVHILGRRADAPWLAADFAVGVMTSHFEGLPNVVMECMYWAKPVITTDAGGCREVVAEGETGFVVPLDDRTAMVARLLRLLDDPSLARRLGERGRERLERDFALGAMVRNTVAIYDELRRARQPMERAAGAAAADPSAVGSS
jgi:glycosyltransferase involved in cell wall biosynthesis